MHGQSCSQVWHKFAHSTTFHGIVKIAETSEFKIRRSAWLVIVLACFALFVYQATERLLFYLSHPVSVNNVVQHNDSLVFPAFVICNANSFRLSAVHKRGWFNMLDTTYSLTNSTDPSRYNESDTTLLDIYLSTAHRKEDLIIKCSWDREECGPENFTRTLTDHGVCFTFNNQKEKLVVKQTGAASGLRLLVNVEQYEYMRGPHHSAGLKVLLFPHNEVPSVINLAEAVPVGAHAFIGADLKQVDNLGAPHGSCVEQADYSHSRCLSECKARVTADVCGCTDFYMKNVSGDQPICTLRQHIKCLRPRQDEISKRLSACECSAPCHYSRYRSTVTYASTPTNQLQGMSLSDNTSSRIRAALVQASEVAQRVFPHIALRDEQIIAHTWSRYGELRQSIAYVSAAAGQIMDAVTACMEEIRPRLWFHYTWGMERVEYTIFNDFVRLWKVVDERTLQHVTSGYKQFSDLVKDAIEMTIEHNNSTSNQRAIWHELIDKDIRYRKHLIQRAAANLTHIHDGFVNGTTRFVFLASPKRKYDTKWMPSEVFYTNSYRQKLFDDWHSSLGQYLSTLDSLQQQRLEMFQNMSFNADLLSATLSEFEEQSVRFNSFRSDYHIRVVSVTQNTVNDRVQQFLQMNKTVYDNAADIAVSFEAITSLVSDSLKPGRLSEALNISREYSSDKTLRKLDVAEVMVSDEVNEGIAAMNTWMKDLRSRSVQMMDSLVAFSHSFINLYLHILQETYTSNFYESISEHFIYFTENRMNLSLVGELVEVWGKMLELKTDTFLELDNEQIRIKLNADFSTMNISWFIGDLRAKMDEVEAENRLTDRLIDEVDLMNRALTALQARCEEYMDSVDIDNVDFYRNTFLQMFVYLKQLSYDRVVQQPAYDVNALLSDIGGAMGLCIGASAITMFEILDAFVVHAVVRFFLPRRAKTSSRYDTTHPEQETSAEQSGGETKRGGAAPGV